MSSNKLSIKSNNKVLPLRIEDIPTTVEGLRSKITWSEAKPLGDMGMQQSYLMYDGTQLMIQFPRMRNISGLKRWEKTKGKPEDGTNDNITLSMGGDDAKVRLFNEFLNNLDTLVQEEALTSKSGIWVKTKGKTNVTRELVESNYNSIVSHSLDDNGEQKYPDSFKLKLGKARDTGSYLLELYDESKVRVRDEDFDDELGKGSMVRGIILFNGVWFGKTGFGVRLTPKQLQTNQQKKLRGFAMIEESSDDEDEVEKDEVEETEAEPKEESESESEAEESDEEERPPTPPPVVEKKSRGKKKSE